MAENNLITKRQEKIITQLGGDVSTLKTNLESERWDKIEELATGGGTGGTGGDGSAGDLDVKIDLASYVTGKSILTSMTSSSTSKSFIKKVNFTNADLSTATSMESMFYNCYYLTEVLGIKANTITSMKSTFESCERLTKVELYNTSNVTTFYSTFYNCKAMTELTELDGSSVTTLNSCFSSCNALTNFGGFKNLGKAYTATTENNGAYALDLTYCTLLTHESLMNVINGLYDLNLTYDVANGGTLYRQRISLSTQSKDLLTADEIAIATNKGWNVV